jgi:hypothetical protein
MGKVHKYAASPAGQKRMKKCIEDHRKSGTPLASGEMLIDERAMREAANILISIIQSHLPESIASVGGSLSSTSPTDIGGGNYEVQVQFSSGALRRESLDSKNGRTGEGINNIVALLNNGYRASGQVYGWWDGHSGRSPETTVLSSGSGYSFAWVKSRQEREALHFMQAAVAEFNAAYGSTYNVTATLSGEYMK